MSNNQVHLSMWDRGDGGIDLCYHDFCVQSFVKERNISRLSIVSAWELRGAMFVLDHFHVIVFSCSSPTSMQAHRHATSRDEVRLRSDQTDIDRQKDRPIDRP